MRNYGQSDNIHVTKTLQKRPDKMLSNVVRRNASWMDLVAQREEDGKTPTPTKIITNLPSVTT